jgi:hypothetical protein
MLAALLPKNTEVYVSIETLSLIAAVAVIFILVARTIVRHTTSTFSATLSAEECRFLLTLLDHIANRLSDGSEVVHKEREDGFISATAIVDRSIGLKATVVCVPANWESIPVVHGVRISTTSPTISVTGDVRAAGMLGADWIRENGSIAHFFFHFAINNDPVGRQEQCGLMFTLRGEGPSKDEDVRFIGTGVLSAHGISSQFYTIAEILKTHHGKNNDLTAQDN